MFTDGFPKGLRADVQYVSSNIPIKTYNDVRLGVSEDKSSWLLLDSQVISFPYRIYYIDDIISFDKIFTPKQMTIYHCIFSRSCDGYIREKHIKALLNCDLPVWAIPYILKISDEYVMEILDIIYLFLKDIDTNVYKKVCQNNLQMLLYGHDRMISYWNEFYRTQCYRYHQYVGYKLFKECFGYTRSMEKLRETRRVY